MRSLNNLGRFVIAGACLFAIVAISSSSATARPQYQKAMSAEYPELTEKHGNNGKLSCAVCHPTKKKKERNNYGAAFGKGLEKKNEKDEAALKKALESAAKEKSATEGKTFGDLIKAGELPGTEEVAG